MDPNTGKLDILGERLFLHTPSVFSSTSKASNVIRETGIIGTPIIISIGFMVVFVMSRANV